MKKKIVIVVASILLIISIVSVFIIKYNTATHYQQVTESDPSIIDVKEPIKKIRKPRAVQSEIKSITGKSPIDGLNDTNGSIQKDLDILQNLFFHYQTTFKTNPNGTQKEIVNSLLGNNAKKIIYIPKDNPSLNADKQIIDRWGTPFFFHQISHNNMEIISAGPDKNLWSEDDISMVGGFSRVEPKSMSANSEN